MAALNSDKNLGINSAPESAPATVTQPVKIQSHLNSGLLGSFLEDINSMVVSEKSASGPSDQWSQGSGAAMTAGTQSSTPVVSARDQAIANLPTPTVMQKQLEQHIKTEVKNLRKQARSITRMSQPGSAYKLSKIYKRIHDLNGLLGEVFGASYEVLKRLFIRVFIDKQSTL